MLRVPASSDPDGHELSISPQSTIHTGAGAANDDPLAGPGLAHYDTYQPFEPLEEEQLSRPSTAQSSRSQTPDNTDVDDNAALLEQFEKVSLDASSRLKGAAGKSGPKEAHYMHINDLPIDIMHEIVQFLDNPGDLLQFMLVQRRWFGLAVPRVWQKPATQSRDTLDKLCAVLRRPLSEQMHPYAQHISRLNFTAVSRDVTDEHVRSMQQCVNLKRLTLARCRNVSSLAVEKVVENARSLCTLELDEVPINDAFLFCVAWACPELQLLYADTNGISDAGLAALGPSLRRVRLKRGNLVTPRGVLKLALTCRNLVELDVAELQCFSGISSLSEHTHGFEDRDIQRILVECEPLRTLKISGSPRLTDSVFDLRSLKLLPRLSNLRELHISCSPLVTDAGILRITQTAPRLRLLNISRCFQITDRSLDHIARVYAGNLESLHIGHCMNITDRGVITITEHCHRLWFFDAATCTNLTDHAIVRLTRLRNLKRIGIVKCTGITDRSVLAISESLPGVERLHLSYCAAITQSSVTRLLDRCRHIVHLSLTGVPAFMHEDIRRMARAPPDDLSEHQRQVFCVFSQSGVSNLRKHLLETYMRPCEEIEQARRSMLLAHMRDAEIPIDQFAPEELELIVENLRANLYARREREQAHQEELDVTELQQVQVQQPQQQPQQLQQLQPPQPPQQQPWRNPNMLPVRDGLVRFGPRGPIDMNHPAPHVQIYREIMAFNERLARLDRSVTRRLRATGTDADDDGAQVTVQEVDAGLLTEASEEPPNGPLDGPESPPDHHPDGPLDEPQDAPQAMPETETRGTVQQDALSVAELRERRFRSSFQRSAPTGPLEGTSLPPQ